MGPYCIRNEIAAYALRGDFEKMLEAIKDMRLSGLQTFSAVNRLLENILTAAETAGNGDEVMGHMEAISKTLQIRPLVFWEILLALVQSNKQFHDEVQRIPPLSRLRKPEHDTDDGLGDAKGDRGGALQREERCV